MVRKVQSPISIPEPTNEVDALWRTTQALKEAVEVLQGIRGDRAAALAVDLEQSTTAITRIIHSGDTGLSTHIANTTIHHGDHTGEVTGVDEALTLDVTAITNRADVVADSADDVAVHDDTDGTIKKVNLSSITDAGYF